MSAKSQPDNLPAAVASPQPCEDGSLLRGRLLYEPDTADYLPYGGINREWYPGKPQFIRDAEARQRTDIAASREAEKARS